MVQFFPSLQDWHNFRHTHKKISHALHVNSKYLLLLLTDWITAWTMMIIGDFKPRRCDSLDELWHIAYADLGLDYWLTPCCQTLPTPPLPARHIIRFRLTHGWNTIYWLFTLLGTLYMVLFIRDILYQLHWLLPALKEFHNEGGGGGGGGRVGEENAVQKWPD